eukprot:TRINITY_DN8689_c0_g2_i3.p1 TRINITY_DN8689_c0_g2~~TRINITY_DN8689_c0_g2_i3.p1  ORF type:complete len:248 (+),score=47.01 TRINITY_DN8689_c0_g2_i3:60-803(+)
MSLQDLHKLRPLFGPGGDLASATGLYLKDRSMRDIPKCISLLTNLLWIDVSKNQLTSLPSSVETLEQLRELILDDNCFPELPTEISCLTSLTFLSIKKSPIAEVPVWITHLRRLQKFALGDEPTVKRAPKGITSLPCYGNELNIPNLSTLHLFDDDRGDYEECQICDHDIMMKATDWAKLRQLNLARNELRCLSPAFAEFIHLESLNLSKNKIREIPSQFSQMKRLKKLDISFNMVCHSKDDDIVVL